MPLAITPEAATAVVPPPLCRDCGFSRPSWWFVWFPGGLLQSPHCGHPSAVVPANPQPDPVTGRRDKPARLYCSSARRGACGPAGRYWQAAPPWRRRLLDALRLAGPPLGLVGYVLLLCLIWRAR